MKNLKRAKQITSEQYKEIKGKYDSGHRIEELCVAYNMAYGTMYGMLKYKKSKMKFKKTIKEEPKKGILHTIRRLFSKNNENQP